MRQPKMILFDYAHTLAWEPDADFLRVERAVFRHVTAIPRDVTPEEASRLGTELFLAARDYGVHKPNPLIFRAALSMAELAPEDVWFCGDQISADIFGAQAANLFPIWYEDLTIPNGFSHKNAELTITGEHLHIHHWHELLDALDACR